MNRLLPVLLFCAACHTPATTPATKAGGDLQVQVVRLEHTHANEMAQVVAEVIRGPHARSGDLKVVAHAEQNALVLSGTTEQISEALSLVARLDVRSAR